MTISPSVTSWFSTSNHVDMGAFLLWGQQLEADLTAAYAGDSLGTTISPSQITSDQNNYAPTAFATSPMVRLNSDATRSITGLAGGAAGRLRIIHNVGASNIVLKNESASSSAANRFALSADVTIGPNQAVLLQYDGTSSRWRVIGGTAGSSARETLTGNRTYYVRSDGSDSNDGLADTAGGAFLTLQKAVNVVAALDMATYSVTIQARSNTYTAGVSVTSRWLGSGTVTLVGDVTTPSNCTISTTASCVAVSSGGVLSIQGFKLVSTSGAGISTSSGGTCTVTGKCDFGACGAGHVVADGLSRVTFASNYDVSGNAPYHWAAINASAINANGRTLTISGTPAFGTAFAYCDRTANISAISNTFSGSATGLRYFVTANGVVHTNGSGATYLPGDTAGATGTGGQYI